MGLENETINRETLKNRQLNRLRQMLSPILESNAFYRKKLNQAGISYEHACTLVMLRTGSF